jgi:hypothetical protein
MGAAVGGGTALLTGNDPLRGALLGGVTGGAGGAFSNYANTGSLFGANAAGAEVAKTAMAANAAKAAAPQALNTQLASTAVQPVNTGISNYVNPSVDTSVYTPSGFDAAGAMRTINPTQSAGIANALPQTVTPPPVANKGIFDSLMDKYEALSPGQQTATKIGLGIAGGVGLNALAGGMKPPTIETQEEEENPFGLATYDRSKYTSINPIQHNVYRPVYGAEGGVMNSYAQGGIAALAAGGMGNNSMYPMGQMDMTQYATPSQMPTSAEVVNADYEQKTDPYTGSPIGMADGGTTRVRPNMGSLSGYSFSNLGTGLAGLGNREAPKPDAVKAYEAYVNETAIPTVYNSGYQDYVSGTPMVTTPEAFDEAPNFMDAYNLLAATSPNIAGTISPGALAAATGSAEGMASGGIAGYNLGGYASGGNPRLLKGPGDGMSDNIPATIGGRQPARLADGEFVVPADVVSHLGNGSTDAGAKHLYKMMDKVRKARTGNKKQGKQIKPGKFLPA